MPEQIDAARVKETSYAVLNKWFVDVESIIRDYNIQPRDIYNMDETGYSIGSIKATRVIIDKQRIFGILQFLAVKNGCRLLNLSAWTESRFLRSSFLRGKLSLENGSLKPMLRLTGSFQSTVKVGQAMHTSRSG